MSWPTVHTRIFPFHYHYIAFILSFVFPPEATLCITRNMKKYDEEENRKEHLVMYDYGHIIHNLVKIPSEAIYYCRSSIKEIYRYSPRFTTSVTMIMRDIVVRKIKSIGERARRHSTTTNFIFWAGEIFYNNGKLKQVKSIANRMLTTIKKENKYENYIDIIISLELKKINEVNSNDKEMKIKEKKRLKKMKIREQMMKNKEPIKYIQFSKNIKHYNKKPMRYNMSRNLRRC